MQRQLRTHPQRRDSCVPGARVAQPISGCDAAHLRARLIWLRDPAAYPDRPAAVIPVETSRSWVFLTDRFAYKLKKPIRHPLVDLSTLGARKANAKAEVRLNRRLASRIYLGIVELSEGPSGKLVLGGHGRAVIGW